ncbi:MULTISPECIES: ABC transporter permease [Clostridium]|uniref:ABC transporter permease n=1 Tax=Clostridium TaxID=1485 RepID=UPI0009C0D14D|nr:MULTISPECIES: ABC transporter permease [Clostridium]PJI08102.1 molybdate ABC transporter permease subunit [Clostridium sp. CT7]
MVQTNVKLNNKEYEHKRIKSIINYDFGEKTLAPTFIILTVIYFMVLIAPIAFLVKYSGIINIVNTICDSENIKCIGLTLWTSLVSLALTFIFGTATAFYISGISNKFMVKLLDIMVEMPVVLPPAVAGISLLLVLGNNSFIGKLLSYYNINIVFTPIAVVIAQFFVSSAFYVKALRNSIRDVPDEIFEASYVFGAGKLQTNVMVIIPMLKRTIISGLILAWIRSMGEFGATLMFAGNILDKTRTISLQIYTYMQSDIKEATAFAAILYFLSFSMLLAIKTTQNDD